LLLLGVGKVAAIPIAFSLRVYKKTPEWYGPLCCRSHFSPRNLRSSYTPFWDNTGVVSHVHRRSNEFSVLAHEAAHDILHRDRDNRPKSKKVREIEAVAFVVCHGIGLDTNSASSDYIQLYNGDKDTSMKSLGRIQRTTAEILGALMDKGSEGETAGGEACAAVAA